MSDEERRMKSIAYLNEYLLPNNHETSTPFVNNVRYSENIDVELDYEQIDENAICLHVTTNTHSRSVTLNTIEVKLRLEKSDYIYNFQMNGLTSCGATKIFCHNGSKNKLVPSLKIADVQIHHRQNEIDEWSCSRFQVAINGKFTNWYLADYSYDNYSVFWTSGYWKLFEGEVDKGDCYNHDCCLYNNWCRLKTHDSQ